jgi:branched-chain amino acid transport system ATP-binding protein
VLEGRELRAGYGDATVLRDLSVRVETSEILGVLGRNGMGKTTLMRTLVGLLRPSSGRVEFDGRDITRMRPHDRARAGIILVAQGRGVFPDLSVRENLDVGRISSGRAGTAGRLDEVLGYFPRLGERMDQKAGTMSGGEQQMLVTARALMAEPQVLLLDEPSDGIMPILVTQMADILKEVNRREGLTTVIVEQNVPMVFRMASRCLVIEKGAIVAEGTPDELAGSSVMKEHLAI